MVSRIDLDGLLKVISAEAPSGEKDLESDPRDPDFVELTDKIKKIDGKIPSDKKPSWSEIQNAAIDLSTRTHDLRVAMILTRTLLHTQGLIGFHDGLYLIQRYIEQYWDSLYPQPKDASNPFERTNILYDLCDWKIIIEPLMKTPLCSAPRLGNHSLRDIRIATNKKTGLVLTEEEKKAPPSLSTVDAAFKECKLEDLQAAREATQASTQHINTLKTVFKKKTKKELDLTKLSEILKEINDVFDKQLAAHDLSTPSTEKQKADNKKTKEAGIAHRAEPVDTQTERSVGLVKNRQDVVHILGQICAYYEQNEPGSPVPLLLKRALKLVGKNFLEIMKDLAPDSVDQIKKSIAGSDELH